MPVDSDLSEKQRFIFSSKLLLSALYFSCSLIVQSDFCLKFDFNETYLI